MQSVGIISKTTTYKGEQMIPKGYKHTELGVLPEDWEVVRLGDVCEIRNGFAFQSKKFKKSGFPIVRISNIKSNNSISLKDMVYFSSDDYKNKDLKNFIVHQNDVLVALSGATTGKIGKMKEDVILYLNQRVGKFQPSERLNNNFLYQCLLLQSNILFLLSGGGAQPNLSTTTIKNKIFIPLPPLAYQEKIAEILSTWDTQIQNLESLIIEKQNLKKGLCQTLLTAKTRLKGFKEDWEVVRLGDIAEDEDFKRIPVSLVEREKLTKDGGVTYPYYGAMGQVGWINDYIFDEERILLAEDGCPFLEKDKQKSFIAKGKYWVNNHAHILKVNLSRGNNYFLCNQLNRVDYAKYVNGVERLKLNKEVMKEIKILIPSLAEQEKIAEILSEADNEITLLEQKLESLKSQKRGLMQNLLNGKVRVK